LVVSYLSVTALCMERICRFGPHRSVLSQCAWKEFSAVWKNEKQVSFMLQITCRVAGLLLERTVSVHAAKLWTKKRVLPSLPKVNPGFSVLQVCQSNCSKKISSPLRLYMQTSVFVFMVLPNMEGDVRVSNIRSCFRCSLNFLMRKGRKSSFSRERSSRFFLERKVPKRDWCWGGRLHASLLLVFWFPT